MQSLDIVLKASRLFLFTTWGGREFQNRWYLGKIQVVITSEMMDKVRQRMLFSSNYVYRNKLCLLVVCPLGH